MTPDYEQLYYDELIGQHFTFMRSRGIDPIAIKRKYLLARDAITYVEGITEAADLCPAYNWEGIYKELSQLIRDARVN